METTRRRLFAIVGVALPTILVLLSAASDMGVLHVRWPTEPWKLVLASFPVGLTAYLPWIYSTFKQHGLLAVFGVAMITFTIQFMIAFITFVVMFAIGGDTI